MALFFKGVGVGTHHHSTDLRVSGIQAAKAASSASELAMIRHIAKGSVRSLFISVTRSYAVAADQAVKGGKGVPTPHHPGFVCEIETPDALPPSVVIYDPVRAISAKYNDPLSVHTYLHDGGPDLLLGVVDPAGHGAVRWVPPLQPPGYNGAGPPLVTDALIAMVNSLRDAKALCVGAIPGGWVVNRHDVYQRGEAMSEVTTVELQGLENSGPLRFLNAQWWDPSSRFALVTMAGADGGETTLRMDISKQAFIDRVEDEAANEVIERLALPIWRQIVAARQTPRRRQSA